MSDKSIDLGRLIRFVSANERLSRATECRDRAEAEHKSATTEFYTAWGEMTPHERTQLQAAYDERIASKTGEGRP